ncbi:SRPBCC domain-containing protein [Marivita sp. S6314]|uniref:SRPBCC domain-containing protein n=1 Tax=Marivita sp. S6314 TaxID=2926406 RepID=UPI001FF22C60|nr:SRPBCC domain-containing protein [Marivita sp. S6314]MCK0149700.1 SRPBCC domain-containing protein [Marivita sp. S6314]
MTFNPETDLQIERVMRASPEAIWRCWEEPDLFKQWFVPPPVEVTEVDNDLRSGGRAFNVMKLPDGTLMENDGCFLLAEPCRRLVFTDGCLKGFRPAPTPAFMTADVRLIPQDGGTLYTAHVMHSDAAKKVEHEKMGFHDGWGTTFGLLDQLARTL